MLKHHEPYEGGVFAGRQDILHFVEAGLGPAVRGAVLLWGLRRLGKTAILRELQRRLPSPPFLPVYFPLGQRAQAPLSRVLFDLASALCGEVQMDPVQAEDFSEGAGTAFFLGEFLPAFYRALPEAYRPVLLLDDLDALQPGGKGDGTTNALPLGGFLQQLCASEPRLGFVFTTTRRPDELSPEVHAIVYATGAAREREVPPLAAEDVREVLAAASPAERTAPVVEEGAVVRVLELTGGHPHLVQVVCRTLLFHLPQGDDEVAPLLDGRNVEDASSAALQAASGFFEDLWRELPPAERVVLSALAEAAPPGAALGQAELLGALQRLGIRILTPELEYAPESLRRRGLLRETAHGHSFSIELLRRFAAAHRPPAAVKPELEHSVPAAAALFHGATSLHQQGQLEQAREMLRRTLRANPNHVKARIRLGQVLHELGQLEEARRELEEACQYDEEEARSPLLRTLLSQGEEMERTGDGDRALRLYERVLALSPAEPLAKGRIVALWTRRGDQAAEAGDLQGALQAYNQSGQFDKAAGVAERLRSSEHEQAAAEALLHERADDWQRASDIYQRLASEDPVHYQGALDRAREELQVRQRHEEGQRAAARRDWAAAVNHLGYVAGVRPDYKETVDLLGRAATALSRQRRGERAGMLGRVGLLLSRRSVLGGVSCLLSVLLLVESFLLWGRPGRGLVPATGAIAREQFTSRAAPAAPVPGTPPAAAASAAKASALPVLHIDSDAGQEARALGQQALAALQRGDQPAALDLLRQAYRAAPGPRWLYDLGVVHDQLGECDDAAFLYRAAILGKGVPSEELAAVDRRLQDLEAQCHFKKRHVLVADRHRRAERYIGLGLCPLAQSILTGIATPAEKARLAACAGGKPAPRAPERQVAATEKPKVRPPAPQAPPPLARMREPAGGTPPAASGLPALLSVTVRPGATVYLDGKLLQEAPVRDYRVNPGKHTVLLVNDQLGKRQSYPINATAGNTYTITYSWEKAR